MVALPIYESINNETIISDEIIAKSYSYINDDTRVYYFRVTEDQYNELTKNYFLARELATDKIKEVRYTYDELFGHLLP